MRGPHTDEARAKISAGMKGKQNGFKIQTACPHCSIDMNTANMPRHIRACEAIQKWDYLFNEPQTVQQMKSFRRVLDSYGLTIEKFAEIYAHQDGVCAICKLPEMDRDRLVIDHDHITGRVRGLLCSGCNVGIGALRDDPETIRRARDYVFAHHATQIESTERA